MGWDLGRSVLHHTGWQNAKELHRLAQRLPQIREIARTLGRMHETCGAGDRPVLSQVIDPMRRASEELHDVTTPRIPGEMRGIERSGEIGRMLPSEAVLFNHPLLRRVWHARRAERSLATYRVQGVGPQEVGFSDDVDDDSSRDGNRLERGPIIACIDTSGSMAGAPEAVAKALILAVIRVAHEEGRDCLLYAFSGPDEVAECDLSGVRAEKERLLDFLALSFHGGTDVAGPITQAVERVRSARWARADVLVVSDGEFPVPNETIEMTSDARSSAGLRVHGVLVASGRSPAMEALCRPLHRFHDWDALASHRDRG